MPFDEFFGGCISRDFDGRIAISRAILKIAFSAKVEMLNNVFFADEYDSEEYYDDDYDDDGGIKLL